MITAHQLAKLLLSGPDPKKKFTGTETSPTDSGCDDPSKPVDSPELPVALPHKPIEPSSTPTPNL